jgi:hypothetical protein
VSRKVVFLAVGVVLLLVLAGAAALLVDAVEVIGPEISGQGSCGQGPQNVFLSVQGSDAAACQWEKALSRRVSRRLLLNVNENESGAFRATATITTVTADPLIAMVQRGDGQNANAFAGIVVGYVTAGGNSFTWSAPTVTIGQGQDGCHLDNRAAIRWASHAKYRSVGCGRQFAAEHSPGHYPAPDYQRGIAG